MAVSWQNERTIELTVMIGTMLQDELNAITVGIFLQVESGYMTWLNYGLLDTLSPWSHGGAHGGAASAPYLRRRRTQVHMGLYQQAWLGGGCGSLTAAGRSLWLWENTHQKPGRQQRSKAGEPGGIFDFSPA